MEGERDFHQHEFLTNSIMAGYCFATSPFADETSFVKICNAIREFFILIWITIFCIVTVIVVKYRLVKTT